jgi:tRNA G46 methylase TrmB
MRPFRSQNIPVPSISEEISARILKKSIDVEIGAGQGLHAIKYCTENPNRTLLAIERTHEKFAKLEGRANSHPHLINLVPVHGDAVAWFTHHLNICQVERVFLLYPNPYPKSKHANQRWHNSSFVSMLLTRLAANGELILATNLDWYATEAEEQFTRGWNLPLVQKKILNTKIHIARTHFERKYLERGESCFNLVFKKSSAHLSIDQMP